jgi:CHAP domain
MTQSSEPKGARAGIHELKQEVRELRRANERRGARTPSSVGGSTFGSQKRRPSPVRSRRSRRRFGALLGAGVIVIVVAATVNGLGGNSDSRPVPSNASLAGLSTRERIVAIANSQVGYSSDPQHSYCNKFSAYWSAGSAGCPIGEMSEKWCADFAAWVWQKAGVRFTYGYNPGQINARAASFYTWGLANGDWHPARSGYVAAPGDVAVYGLSLGADPSAAHVAIVTDDTRGQRGPDVDNGDGDRTGFSVVEPGTDETRADTGHNRDSPLAGYVSPP